MRQRTLERDWNIRHSQYKSHLWRLPNLNEPTPDYPGESKDALVIIPIMEGGDNRLLEDHIVRSACWARRSWLLFSDAIDLDIAVKFYIDETPGLHYNRGTIIQILKDNHVDIEKDVLWCDMSRFDGLNVFAKKHAFYVDDQLSGYKWVYALDADMFLASRNKEKFNFFERLISHEETMGVTEIHHDKDYVMMASRFWTEPLADIIKYDLFGKGEEVKQWLEKVRELSDERVIDLYYHEPTSIVITKMPIIAYPARQFSNIWNDEEQHREWFAKAGELLGHDEETMSVYDAMGYPLWDISKEVGLPVYWWERDKNMGRDYPVYLCHACDMSAEYLWRKDIDAL